MDERELSQSMYRFIIERDPRVWPLVYAALQVAFENKNALAGAIVGAPAMPEDFE